MKIGFTSRNFDTVMVMDAILISLAGILVILAYRELNEAPLRHATALARAMISVSDDFAEDNLVETGLDENGAMQLEKRYRQVQERVRAAVPGAELAIYSEHPMLAGISARADDFRRHGLAKAEKEPASRLQTIGEIGDGRVLRIAQPIIAFRDCARCEAAGYEPYSKGDVIGIREVIVPVGDQYAQTVRKLLYACGLLASALMVFIGLIIPVFKSHRQERAQIGDLAISLEMEAITDPLTGLRNRRYFERALANYLHEFNKQKCSLGLLILDLDHFKNINDTYGHDCGDLVLKEVALRLNAITRQHDVVARIGGEEFAVITPFIAESQLLSVAERYREAIESLKIDLGSLRVRPTVSIGVATNANGSNRIDDMFKAADLKLYEAKRNGRNQIAA